MICRFIAGLCEIHASVLADLEDEFAREADAALLGGRYREAELASKHERQAGADARKWRARARWWRS